VTTAFRYSDYLQRRLPSPTCATARSLRPPLSLLTLSATRREQRGWEWGWGVARRRRGAGGGSPWCRRRVLCRSGRGGYRSRRRHFAVVLKRGSHATAADGAVGAPAGGGGAARGTAAASAVAAAAEAVAAAAATSAAPAAAAPAAAAADTRGERSSRAARQPLGVEHVCRRAQQEQPPPSGVLVHLSG